MTIARRGAGPRHKLRRAQRGRAAIWEQDAAGFLTYFEYDPATGALTKQIQDVNTDSMSGLEASTHTDLVDGWSSPTGAPLNLTTQWLVDGLGRVTESIDPKSNITYTVYLDSNFEVRTYAGWVSGAPTAPIQVVREEFSSGATGGPVIPNSYIETFNMTATPATEDGAPNGTETISGLTSLSRSILNDAGQVIESDAYFHLDGLSYSTDTLLDGASDDTDYYKTSYSYDASGLLDRASAPISPTAPDTGYTISHTVYDSLGRIASTWVGTSDATGDSDPWSPVNMSGTEDNMVQVTANIYDFGGVGDSNLTMALQFPNTTTATASAFHVTENTFDWRDRLYATKQGAAVTLSTSSGTGESHFDHTVTGISGSDPYIVNFLTGTGSEADDTTTVRPINYVVTWMGLGSVIYAYTYAGNTITADEIGDGGAPSAEGGHLRSEFVVSVRRITVAAGRKGTYAWARSAARDAAAAAKDVHAGQVALVPRHAGGGSAGSRRYAQGSRPWRRRGGNQAGSEWPSPARPRSLPQNNQFLRPMAMARISRSASSCCRCPMRPSSV